MNERKSRYRGVQPYKTSDQQLFFGRDEDIENLHDFILLEKMVVLFGKSGYGKSSLLNAGIVPLLQADSQPEAFRFRPLEVRFTDYDEKHAVSPLETLTRLIADIPADPAGDFLTGTGIEDSLWIQLKRRQSAGNGRFVLLFDQFEEFFSYPPAQQEVFRRQLAELLFTDIPQSLRQQQDTLDDEARRYLSRPMNVKAVFAIRSDRMSQLDSLKDTLPAILHKRYELRPLTTEQASDAIVKPARLVDEKAFDSPAFEYTEDGLQAILHALGSSNTAGSDSTAGIEAFQLQIICEYLESRVRDGLVPDLDGNGLPDITRSELPEMDALYENYYHRKLGELVPEDREKARTVLEDILLAEDTATGEGRRKSVDSLDLLSNRGVTPALLDELEKTYLIRQERNTVGGKNYEISHDTLLAPILKARAKRKAEEVAIQQEKDRIEAEERAREARRMADEERRKAEEAERLRQEAESARKEAEEQRKVALSALENIRVKNRTSFDAFSGIGTGMIYSLDHEQALSKMRESLEVEVDERMKREKLTEPLFELLYFFAEGGRRLELAREAAGLLLQLSPDADLAVLLRRCVEEEWKERNQFRILLEGLPTYCKLRDRYYPKTVRVLSGAGGVFKMGSDATDRDQQSDEVLHEVSLSSYEISVSPITFYQYSLYCESADIGLKSRTPYWGRCGDHPVVNVSWYDAVEYTNWLNVQEGYSAVYDIERELNSDPANRVSNDILKWKVEYNPGVRGYRLPTEAEWEMAARGGAGSRRYIYSGGDDLSLVGWYWENSGDKALSGDWDLNRIYNNNCRTHPVGEKLPNELGLFDMSGNVWEWCWDWYDSGYYEECKKEGLVKDPAGAEGSTYGRVVRGGSWNDYPQYCRVAYRYRFNPGYRIIHVGFRLVLVPQSVSRPLRPCL